MRGLLIAAALLLASAGSSMASTVTVSFSGTVGASAGEIQGVTLGQGETFSGTFTFDPASLTPSPNNAVPGLDNDLFTNAGAIQAQIKVGSDTFNYGGSNNSSITVLRNPDAGGNQHFNISTSDASPFSLISLTVIAPALYGDPAHLSTLATFSGLAGDLSFIDSIGGSFGSGALHASSVSLAVATTPIPAALPLFLSAIAGLGWFGLRRRKADAMPVPAAA